MPVDLHTLLTTSEHYRHWALTHPYHMAAGVAGVFALAGAAGRLQRHLGAPRPTHGSAHWATTQDIRRLGLFRKRGLVLGKWGRRFLRYDGEEHCMLIAPSRSGKGVGPIISSLLCWPESAIVLDPKEGEHDLGENYEATVAWRQYYTAVHAFTPHREPHAKFNVLDTIRVGSYHEIPDATCIADSLTTPHHEVKESDTSVHFRELTSMLLRAVLLHLCYVGKRKSPAGALAFLTQDHRSIHEALKTLEKTKHLHAGIHGTIQQLSRAIQNISNERELSGVWTTAIRALEPYGEPTVAASTDDSDFSIDDLQYGPYPATLYLIAPSPLALERYYPIYRVILDVMMERLTMHPVRTYQWRLFNCLDELPWWGYSKGIDKGSATRAGYGHLDLYTGQDLGSFSQVYGAQSAIWGNSRVKMWYAPYDDHTARRLSTNILGKETIQTHSHSSQFGQWNNRISVQNTGRELLQPDEVMGLSRKQAIIQMDGKRILASKVDYRQVRTLRKRSSSL